MSQPRPSVATWALCLALGFALTLPAAEEPVPSRIVSLSPNITEILFAIGVTNSVVGVSDYCELPQGLDIPRCGGVLNPSLERILALQPTNILMLGRMDKVHSFADQNKLQATSIMIDSTHELYKEIQHIGNLVGIQRNAWHLVQRLEGDKQIFSKKHERAAKYRALVLVGREAGSTRKMMAVGGPSFISEMLTLAHGENIFGDQAKPYFEASLESIVALQPEVIFEIRDGEKLGAGEMQKLKDDWKEQSTIPAVKYGRIVVATNDFLSIPGPRMLNIAEYFADELQKLDAGAAERKP